MDCKGFLINRAAKDCYLFTLQVVACNIERVSIAAFAFNGNDASEIHLANGDSSPRKGSRKQSVCQLRFSDAIHNKDNLAPLWGSARFIFNYFRVCKSLICSHLHKGTGRFCKSFIFNYL
jgi:hypothetical protein